MTKRQKLSVSSFARQLGILESDLLHAISERLQAFTESTGVPVRGMSVHFVDVSTAVARGCRATAVAVEVDLRGVDYDPLGLKGKKDEF